MKRALKLNARQNHTQVETDFFSGILHQNPDIKRPSRREEGSFIIRELTHPTPMGYSLPKDGKGPLPGIDWANKELRDSAWAYCPELKSMLSMRFEYEKCSGEEKPP
jgi:hypothetical protein